MVLKDEAERRRRRLQGEVKVNIAVGGAMDADYFEARAPTVKFMWALSIQRNFLCFAIFLNLYADASTLIRNTF